MLVSHILDKKGRDVLTVRPEDSVGDVAAQLSEKGIGAVPVLDGGGVLVGIVSERDMVAALVELGRGVLDQAVARVMTRQVVTCGLGDHIDDLMVQMTEKRMRHLPVLEDGRLVGIVSIGDVVKARIGEVEAEARALKDYIATS